MSDVAFTIVPAEVKASESAVEVLERMLARARAGEIVDVAIAGVSPGGFGITSYSADVNALTLLGSVECLRTRLLRGVGV